MRKDRIQLRRGRCTRGLVAVWANFLYDRIWAIWDGSVYDLSDYVNTASIYQSTTSPYQFLNTAIVDVFKQQAGQDISKNLNKVIAGLDSQTATQNVNCIKNMFYLGQVDFRKSPRCTVQSYLLLVFTGILCASIALKCELRVWLGGC